MPERINFEGMNEHDLLVVVAKSFNDLNERVGNYCERVNEQEERITALENRSRTFERIMSVAISLFIGVVTALMIRGF